MRSCTNVVLCTRVIKGVKSETFCVSLGAESHASLDRGKLTTGVKQFLP